MTEAPRVIYSPDIFGSQSAGGISRYFAELHRRRSPELYRSILISGAHRNEYIRGIGGTIGVRLPAALPSRASYLAYRLANRAIDIALPLGPGRGAVFHKTYYDGSRAPDRARVVVTIYDMIHELFPKSFPPTDSTADRKRYWLARADLILTLNDCTKCDLEEIAGVPAGRVRAIPLGADHLPLKPRSPNRSAPFVLYVGNRGGYKNFPMALRALEIVRRRGSDVQLVCFGGPPWTSVERELIGIGIDQWVRRVVGTDEDLSALYAAATALVYPSRYEGFGLPPLEAMRAGCPVVASGVRPMQEIMPTNAVLAAADDVDAFSDAIEAFLRMPAASEAEISHAAAFTWDQTAALTAHAYRELS